VKLFEKQAGAELAISYITYVKTAYSPLWLFCLLQLRNKLSQVGLDKVKLRLSHPAELELGLGLAWQYQS